MTGHLLTATGQTVCGAAATPEPIPDEDEVICGDCARFAHELSNGRRRRAEADTPRGRGTNPRALGTNPRALPYQPRVRIPHTRPPFEAGTLTDT